LAYKYKGTKNIPLLQLLKQLSYIELTFKIMLQLKNINISWRSTLLESLIRKSWKDYMEMRYIVRG